MSIVELDQSQIHYKMAGPQDAPVLVLSHSLGVSLDMWQPQIDVLASDFRVLAYDTRGHGRTTVQPGPYTIAELGGDVIRLLDALEIERASFCGLSMGGVIGQWLGIHAALRLEHLVLANTAAKIGNAEGWNARIESVEQEGLQPIITGTLERWFTAEFRSRHADILASTRQMLEATSAEGYLACCAAIRDADFRESVASIQVPTLVIAGLEDPVTPASDCRLLSSSIAGARLVELDAAHLSNLGASSEFSTAISDFLGTR